MRNLIVILGDQLDRNSAVFEGFDNDHDSIWMAEVSHESTYVWSNKHRICMFLSAMRHYRDELADDGFTIDYHTLEEGFDAFSDCLDATVERLKPEKLILVEPGEWRVEQEIRSFSKTIGIPLELREDDHFLCSKSEFRAHAENRKQLRLEYFYRELRRKHRILVDGGKPAGGRWNFDQDNRGSFGKKGPRQLPQWRQFPVDNCTRQVITDIESRFRDHPGELDNFDWPVNRADALDALADFIDNRLPLFGHYQDAMWTDSPVLYHARISAALNVKLLSPREVIEAALDAHRDDPKKCSLNSVEGFVRQILGWREYVRGIYWSNMPGFLDMNVLAADQPLPPLYWTAETDMVCLQQVISQSLRYGYAHHIQRLMVTGLFALLLGVRPTAIHEWYLAVYVDAVEWVEAPNTLGMSQHADGGMMASKPYAATGKYIARMSNYCASCRYDPAQSTGNKACPFTTLYWDFLMRHEKKLGDNQRMRLQLRNLTRLDSQTRITIRRQADSLKQRMSAKAV